MQMQYLIVNNFNCQTLNGIFILMVVGVLMSYDIMSFVFSRVYWIYQSLTNIY
jgi:hypothetical protein